MVVWPVLRVWRWWDVIPIGDNGGDLTAEARPPTAGILTHVCYTTVPELLAFCFTFMVNLVVCDSWLVFTIGLVLYCGAFSL